MAKSGNQVFRQEALDQLSAPDELTDCLKVTNPSVWAILAAVILLLAGLLAWACVGTLPTRAQAKVIVKDGSAAVWVSDPYVVREGMRVAVDSQEFSIASTDANEYGQTIGIARVNLGDGAYEGTAVVDETHAIDFLLQSD